MLSCLQVQPTEVADLSFSALCQDLQGHIMILALTQPRYYHRDDQLWEDVMFVSKEVRELVLGHAPSLRLWLDSSRATTGSAAAALAHVLRTRLSPLNLILGLYNTNNEDVSQILQAAVGTRHPSVTGQVQGCCVDTLTLVVSGALLLNTWQVLRDPSS